MLSASDLLKSTLTSMHRRGVLSCFVIDEAHCISQWGHDFRPDYVKMCEFFQAFRSPRVPILALTATATPKTIIDIRRLLRIQNAKMFISSFVRPNLIYEVVQKNAASLKKIATYLLQKNSINSGIFYCLSRFVCAKTKLLLRRLVLLAKIPSKWRRCSTIRAYRRRHITRTSTTICARKRSATGWRAKSRLFAQQSRSAWELTSQMSDLLFIIG